MRASAASASVSASFKSSPSPSPSPSLSPSQSHSVLSLSSSSSLSLSLSFPQILSFLCLSCLSYGLTVDHLLTMTQVSLLSSLSLSLLLSLFHTISWKRNLSYSFLCGLLVHSFLPVLLEYAPYSLLSPFVHFPYRTSLFPNLVNHTHHSVKTYSGLNIQQALEIIADSNEPLIFRNAIQNSEAFGWKLVNRLEKTGKRYLSQRFEPVPYDFFRGSLFHNQNSTFEELFQSGTDYISFEPLLTDEDYLDLQIPRDQAQTDTSFVANFTQTTSTTFIHAEPMSMSVSMQMIGYKSWWFFPPALGDTLNSGWFARNGLASHGDEYLMFASQPSYQVTAHPGRSNRHSFLLFSYLFSR